MPDDDITNYWQGHYADEHCTLCGNWGVIDTRATAITPAGYRAGRLNFCICQNGQTLREQGADINRVLTNEHWHPGWGHHKPFVKSD